MIDHSTGGGQRRYTIAFNPTSGQYDLIDTAGEYATISASRHELLAGLREVRVRRQERQGAQQETDAQQARREAYEAGYIRYQF